MGQAGPEPDEPAARGPLTGRRSGVMVLTLVVGLLVAVVVVAVALRPPGQDTRPVDPVSHADVTPSPASTVPDRGQALQALLDARSRAVLARDRVAWMQTVDPTAGDFAARQAAVFQNLQGVPLQEWSYDLAGNGPSLSSSRRLELAADDAWVARVVLAYHLRESGLGTVRREQYLTVVQRDGRWLLAGDRDGRTAVDLWDLGPVHVTRSARALLIGTADKAALDRFAETVDRAAAHVDEVWGSDWPRTVVVMLPRDQKEMAALMARDSPAGLDQIAAVTTGEIGLDTAATSADRIIINPEGFAKLGPTGRDVVLSHEITHVATRATTTTAVPVWLSEGFADYVAYLPTELTTQQIARDVLSLVPQGKAPRTLPDSTDFDPAVTDIAPAYSAAWLAVHLIAERYGQQGLIEFYRAVADGGTSSTTTPAAGPATATASQAAVDAAFASVLGTDQARFTQDWRAEMARLGG